MTHARPVFEMQSDGFDEPRQEEQGRGGAAFLTEPQPVITTARTASNARAETPEHAALRSST
jgi:hypothetical protein